jgi:hypothetical protein
MIERRQLVPIVPKFMYCEGPPILLSIFLAHFGL